MALARAGDKAGATAALNAVTGPQAEVAKYWLAFLQPRPEPVVLGEGAGLPAPASR